MGQISYRVRQTGKAMAVFLLGFAICGANETCGQDSPKVASPTESYKAALAPFDATRNQPDDLTDADKVALGIGMARAGQDCQALSSNTSSFSQNADQLLALGRLCLFGQQFEQARADLVNYLALPQPPQREQALLMLVHAFLGLDSPGSAEAQIQSLLGDYPYDASIHHAIDDVIDPAEASGIDEIALQLCQTQTAATLPVLKSGRALENRESSVSAAALFSDAMRCAALAHFLGQPDKVNQLVSISQQSSWEGTADLPIIQAAVRRQLMVGEQAPLSVLHAHLLGAATLVRRTISLGRGTALLVPFTLWSPSTPAILANLARSAPHQLIYAITSWHVNTGAADQPSRQLLDGLRSWRRSLPPHVIILILPDAELSSLAADTFPAGIAIRDQKVLANMPLSGRGSQQLLLRSLTRKHRD